MYPPQTNFYQNYFVMTNRLLCRLRGSHIVGLRPRASCRRFLIVNFVLTTHARTDLDHTRRTTRGEKLHFYMRNHHQNGLPESRVEEGRERRERKTKLLWRRGEKIGFRPPLKCTRAVASLRRGDSGFLRLRTKPSHACTLVSTGRQARLCPLEFFALSQLSRQAKLIVVSAHFYYLKS